MKVTIDFETRSAVSIKDCGAWVYAEDQSTEVLCISYKVDEQPTELIAFSQPYGYQKIVEICADLVFNENKLVFVYTGNNSEIDKFLSCIDKTDIVEAHNAGFERAVWGFICTKRHGWPSIPLHKWRCSAAKAAAMGLPRALEDAALELELPVQKDMEGHRIMQKLCKPRKPTKNNGAVWHSDSTDIKRLYTYCMQDTEVEHTLSFQLLDLNPTELRIWQLDQEINARGFQVDLATCENAVAMVAENERRLLKELNTLTGGLVDNVTQINVTLDYIASKGVEMQNLDKNSVIATLKKEDLPEDARRILEIRQSLAMSSNAKYQSYINGANEDGRFRGSLMYFGAVHTGRWAGMRVQPHNLPRGTIKDADTCIEAMKTGDLDLLEMVYNKPMQAMSSCIRGMIIAKEGNELECADFSSIEAIVRSWFVDEKEILDIFRKKEDAYKYTAMGIYPGTTYETVNKDQRTVGKIADLALGYQGGINALKVMEASYNYDIGDDEKRQDIVNKWRKAHPKTKAFWAAMENMAVEALKTGKTFQFNNKIKWGMYKKWLMCQLPSGRRMCYLKPALMKKETPWGVEKEVLTYMGRDKAGNWTRVSTYGGKLVENIVQATARDILAEAMLRSDESKHPIIITIHDEILAEVPKSFSSLKEFEELVSIPPEWAKDCPISAHGWRGLRYKKD